MAPDNFVARARVEIDASVEEVWEALTDPGQIRQYMFGTEVSTDWAEGSPITWKGTWEGREYEDKGQILEFEPPTRLSYSHFSPMAGEADTPANYHQVTIDITRDDGRTGVILTQDNNKTAESREHSQANWQVMLNGLRKHLEEDASAV